MNNYTNNNTARRYVAHTSPMGTTLLDLKNPYITAWWSASFPGFGHFLLSKYIHGVILLAWEFLVNLNAHINLAIMYSFLGDINSAINVLDTKWLLVYTPVYFFGIWHTYKTTVDLNKIFVLAEREEHRFNSFSVNALEFSYLDKKSPLMAIIWSLFTPGLGQLYTNRIFTSFIGIGSSIAVFYFSNFLEAMTLVISGDVQQATSVLNPEWFLFLPSIYGFLMYDAYVGVVEHNKLFEKEQRRFLKDNYHNPNFRILKGKKVK